ncbi:MAG: universal stress protein [Minwuia sp.]|uniref:universal stress protein n=1 Tax=Minwuia sp. TaxID=2493630 RepID=UPI003A8BF346
MAIKDILLHLDPDTDMKTDIAAAVALAEANDAHLAGLYVSVPASQVPAFTMVGLPPDLMESIEAREREAEAAVHKIYEEALSRSSIAVDYRRDSGSAAAVADVIGQHARHSDLLIMGQSRPDTTRAGGHEVVEEAILAAGRPVLVMPYTGTRQTFAKNVVVGWDGSREAARALGDAMPLIEKADKVHVMVVNPDKRRGAHGEMPGADISTHLARHGLKVELDVENARDIDPANFILSRCADIGADLLVMGAFAHSRIQQTLFGGVTRSILQQMTVPVLLSH